MYLHHTDVVLCCVPVSLQQPIQISPSTECFPSTLQTKLFTVFNLLEHSPPVRMAALSPFFSCSSPTLAVSSLPMSSVRAFSLLGLFRVITATWAQVVKAWLCANMRWLRLWVWATQDVKTQPGHHSQRKLWQARSKSGELHFWAFVLLLCWAEAQLHSFLCNISSFT